MRALKHEQARREWESELQHVNSLQTIVEIGRKSRSWIKDKEWTAKDQAKEVFDEGAGRSLYALQITSNIILQIIYYQFYIYSS